VAIGYQAGESFQKVHAISLGAYAGRINQGESSLACGFFCGNNAQGNYAVGLGNACAQSLQGDFAVAIGASSGNIHQGIESLACGSFSGHTNLGYQSVALGHRASYDGGDFSNTIVINATGSDLDPEGTDRTYIKPIRELLNNEFLCYNNISGEVTRSAAVNFTSSVFLNGVTGAFNEVITGDGTGGVFWATPTAPTPIFGSFTLPSNLPVNNGSITEITLLAPQAGVTINGMSINSGTGIITLNTAGVYLMNVGFRVNQNTGVGGLIQSHIWVTDAANLHLRSINEFIDQSPSDTYKTFTLTGHAVIIAPTNNYQVKLRIYQTSNNTNIVLVGGVVSQGVAIQKIQ
jgi:hypothetical protein